MYCEPHTKTTEGGGETGLYPGWWIGWLAHPPPPHHHHHHHPTTPSKSTKIKHIKIENKYKHTGQV